MTRNGPNQLADLRYGAIAFSALLVVTASSIAAPKPPARNVAPQVALAKPAKLELVDVPIQELPGRLNEQFFVNVFLDVAALEKAKIPTDKKVSLSAQYKSLDEGLTALTEAAGLAWLMRGEVIVLTSPDRFGEILDPRVYQLALPAQQADYDKLIDSVVKVSPKSWSEDGGTGAVHELAPDLLIILQSPLVQKQLGKQFASTMRAVDHVDAKNPKPNWPVQTRALARPVSCDFEKKPLAEAIAALARDAKLPLALDDDELKAAGVDAATRVSLRLRAVKLSTVLNLLLEPLELTYLPAKQGLRVTSMSAAENDVSTVIYPVGDLLLTQYSGEELTRVVESSIVPTSWADVGGAGKLKLQADQGMLEVSQYFDAHRQLEQLLADIRAARGR